MGRVLYKVGMGTPPKMVCESDHEIEVDKVYGDEFYPYWCCSGCNDYFAYFSTIELAQKQWDKSDKVRAYCEDPRPCHYT